MEESLSVHVGLSNILKQDQEKKKKGGRERGEEEGKR